MCYKDTLRGFWLGGREEGEGCWDCLPAYYGPSCLSVCPGGRCSPCSLHGTCSNGVNGNGTCSCYSDPVGGYWTGASCQACQPGYWGPNCRGKCNCLDDPAVAAIKCFDGITGNGTCLCPEGRAPPDCRQCAEGRGGPDCTKCPGSPLPCSGNGLCDKTYGNCTCDTGWRGASCDRQCESEADCADNPCFNKGYIRNAVCVCPDNFKGPLCQHKCPEDAWGLTCHGRGQCAWAGGQANATCECDYSSDRGWWGGLACDVCAHSHLSFMNNCSAPCPFDTSTCPSGYQGANCTVRCGGAPESLPKSRPACSGHGNCSCYGDCFCDEGYGGSYCQTACPRSGGLVCGGPSRGRCYDVTGNGTCQCLGNYVGAACEASCDCASSDYGACTSSTNSSVCVCKKNRAGTGCEVCSPGWRGANCSTPCRNGVTNGTACDCAPSWGSIGCALQCHGSPLGLCSGPQQGECQEGEQGTGTCACLPGFYGPSCNCSIALCKAGRPLGTVTCDTSDGQCICAPGFGGDECSDCLSDSFWGSACNELCSCQHGTCGRESGECTCYRDSVNGHWTGELCDECVAGYLPPECKLVSSLTPQLTSLQAGAATSGRSYVAQRLFYDPYEDAVIVSGQMFARFDGAIDAAPRNVSKATAFMMSGCANILGGFVAMNHTRAHVVVNCLPMSSGLQRIDFVSTTTDYPNPFAPLEVTEQSTVTANDDRPAVPVPRFKLLTTATEILVDGIFLGYHRGEGRVTTFGQVNGEAEWNLGGKTLYNSSCDVQCVMFKAQVSDGGSGHLLKLACVAIDPPLSPPESTDLTNAAIVQRDAFFVAPLYRTDSADGYSGESQGVALHYSRELDGILVGTVTDTGTCVIHFIHAAFNTSEFVRLYRSRDCRQIASLTVKDGYVLAGIRRCETVAGAAACSVTRPTVVRFRPVTWTSLVNNPPVTSLAVEPLLTTDYIVAMSVDTLTGALVVLCRSQGNSHKILRVLSTAEDFMVIGSQSSSSPDMRGVVDALVVPERRVLLVLHRSTVGVAVRRYALIEAMSISPEISDRRGGTVITVSGRGFVGGLGAVQCKIGNFVANGTVLDATKMLCVSPIATGTSCTVDTVDVSIYNNIFTVNRLPLRRIDFPKLRSALPDLQHFYSPQALTVDTMRADESAHTRCKYAAVTRSNNNTIVFNGSVVVNGTSYAQDGRILIRCEPPPTLLGSTVATVDVALDGTVFSAVDASELPTIRYLGDPVAITPNPQNIRLSSAAAVTLPQFVASIVDVSGTAFGTQFADIVKFFVTPVLPPPSPNATTAGQIEGVPAASLAQFLHTTPVISSGDRRGTAVFSGPLPTDERIVMVAPVQGVVHLIVNLTSVFDATVYPWSTTFILTVFPGSVQRIVITRQPGDAITVDGLVNDVEVQIIDGAGNTVVGTNNVTIGAAVIETFLGGDPALIPKFITDANPTRPNSHYEAIVASTGTATFKSLRLATRGMYGYALRFYIAYLNPSTAFADYKTSNALDPVNASATAESVQMLPSCNLGDMRTIGSYTCTPCLDHAECGDGVSGGAGGTSGEIRILPGYWRSSAYSSATFACTPPDACLGGPVTGVCAKGYEGPVCSVCSSGHGKSAVKGECEACPALALKVLTFVVLCTGFGMVLGLLVVMTAQSWRRQSVTITLLQLFVDHMHTLMMIGALNLPFPPFFLSAITYSGIFTLQLLDFSVSDCIVREGGNYFTKFFVYAVMAAMSFLAAAVAWVVLFIFPNVFRDSTSRRRHLRRIRNWAREVEQVALQQASEGRRDAVRALATAGPTSAMARSDLAMHKSLAGGGNGSGGKGGGGGGGTMPNEHHIAMKMGHSAGRAILHAFNPKVIDEEMAIALEALTDDESDAEMAVVEEQRAGGGKDGASLASLAFGRAGADAAAGRKDVAHHHHHSRLRRDGRRRDPSVVHKNHSFRLLSAYALQVIMFFMLPSIVYYSLSMFNCTDVPDPYLGDASYMNVDMSIRCKDSTHTTMFAIGITVAALYLVCAPLSYLLLYWRDLRYYHFHVKRRQQTYAFVMMGIKSSQWYWPAVLLLRKGLQAMLVVLLPNPMDAQAFMWLLVLFIVLQIHAWPYLSNRVNYLQTVCALAELFSLCTSFLLDMVNTEALAINSIAAVALIIALSVACLVLFYAAHNTLELLWLHIRVHVFGDNLTETQSTDSFHLDNLVAYRKGHHSQHIPLPPGAEEGEGGAAAMALAATAALRDDTNNNNNDLNGNDAASRVSGGEGAEKGSSPSADEWGLALGLDKTSTASGSRGHQQQALSIGLSGGELGGSGSGSRGGGAASKSSNGGGLASPLLGGGRGGGTTSSFSSPLHASDLGEGYVPPSIAGSPLASLAVPTASMVAPPQASKQHNPNNGNNAKGTATGKGGATAAASQKAGGGGGGRWGNNKHFGVDVEALQVDDHFTANYPSRDGNFVPNATAAAFAAAGGASQVVGSVDKLTTTGSVAESTTPSFLGASHHLGSSSGPRGGGGFSSQHQPQRSNNAAAAEEQPFVSLMPHSTSSPRAGRRRRHAAAAGGEDDEGEDGAIANRIGESIATEGTVPAFASYSSKLSEAVLAAEQRAAEESRQRAEEARLRASRYRRGGSPTAADEGGRGAPRAPGFLGDDAHNSINYASYMRRLGGRGGGDAGDGSDDGEGFGGRAAGRRY